MIYSKFSIICGFYSIRKKYMSDKDSICVKCDCEEINSCFVLKSHDLKAKEVKILVHNDDPKQNLILCHCAFLKKVKIFTLEAPKKRVVIKPGQYL